MSYTKRILQQIWYIIHLPCSGVFVYNCTLFVCNQNVIYVKGQGMMGKLPTNTVERAQDSVLQNTVLRCDSEIIFCLSHSVELVQVSVYFVLEGLLKYEVWISSSTWHANGYSL